MVVMVTRSGRLLITDHFLFIHAHVMDCVKCVDLRNTEKQGNTLNEILLAILFLYCNRIIHIFAIIAYTDKQCRNRKCMKNIHTKY